MKIYIAIEWFHEGDSNLVGAYVGASIDVEILKKRIIDQHTASKDRIKAARQDDKDNNLYHGVHQFSFYKTPVFLNNQDFYKDSKVGEEPKQWGTGYGSPSKWEIREEDV